LNAQGFVGYATTGEKPITGALFVSTVSGTVIEGQTIRRGKSKSGDD
jgi:hypothetical protein